MIRQLGSAAVDNKKAVPHGTILSDNISVDFWLPCFSL